MPDVKASGIPSTEISCKILRKRVSRKVNNTMNAIERLTGTLKRNRLQIKTFRTKQDMNTFLCKDDNAIYWKESCKGLKRGIYVSTGGKWHNVEDIEPSALAHF